MAWRDSKAPATLPLVSDQHYKRSLKALAAAMKGRRKGLGLTQEDVADRLGLVTRQYQKLESGQVNVTLRTLCRIAAALETSVSALLT